MECLRDELHVARTLYCLQASGVANAPCSRPHAIACVAVECDYVRRHLLTAFRRRRVYRVLDDRGRLHAGTLLDGVTPVASCACGASCKAVCVWCEYEDVPWDAVTRQVGTLPLVNNLCVRKGLSRKAHLAKYLTKHTGKCASCPLSSRVPVCVIIDTLPAFQARPAFMDLQSALTEVLLDAEEALDGSAVWILKPSLANKASGIRLVRTCAEVREAVREDRDVGQWVLQRYVENPLCIDGRKFHLRVYVLASDALRVHVWREALLLRAVHRYAHPRSGVDPEGDMEAWLADTYAHITNTCVGADHAAFREEEFVRTLSELPWLLGGELAGEHGQTHDRVRLEERVDELWRQIHDVVRHAFLAMRGEFCAFMPLRNGFELYGVDFLVDTSWRVHLLEFNPTPDVKQTGARLDAMIGAMLDGVMQIVADPLCSPACLPPWPGLESLPAHVRVACRWEGVLDEAWPVPRAGFA